MNNVTDFDKIAVEYNSPLFAKEYLVNPAVLRLVGNVKRKRILDFGCGSGEVARLLAMKGGKVTGVDISKEQIKLAQKIEEKTGFGIEYSTLSLDSLLKRKKKFDVIVSNLVFHYIGPYSRLRKTLKNLAGLLKPRGIVVFSMIHPHTMRNIQTFCQKRKYPKKFYYFKSGTVYTIKTRKKGGTWLTFKQYQRTLEDILFPLFESGLGITGIAETKSNKSFLKKESQQPLFLIIRLKKLVKT